MEGGVSKGAAVQYRAEGGAAEHVEAVFLENLPAGFRFVAKYADCERGKKEFCGAVLEVAVFEQFAGAVEAAECEAELVKG